MAFNDIIGRADVPVPEPVAATVIQDAINQSVVLNRAQRQPMSSKTLKQPVLSTLPEAYWLNGDTDLKQTTKAAWTLPVMTAEEVAAIAVVPDAVFDDSSISLWDALRPLLAEAIGKKVDAATLFGTDKPATWPTAIAPAAIAAGNTMTEAAPDFGVTVANMAQKIAETGYNVNGFITQPGFRWRMHGLRASDGQFIYDPSAQTLYGLPADEVGNGAWATTTPATSIMLVDWTKIFIGIRQDITIKLLDQSVLSDADGKVIVNLAQQDSKALRVVFRVGFQVYTPATRTGDGTQYPAGVITKAA